MKTIFSSLLLKYFQFYSEIKVIWCFSIQLLICCTHFYLHHQVIVTAYTASTFHRVGPKTNPWGTTNNLFTISPPLIKDDHPIFQIAWDNFYQIHNLLLNKKLISLQLNKLKAFLTSIVTSIHIIFFYMSPHLFNFWQTLLHYTNFLTKIFIEFLNRTRNVYALFFHEIKTSIAREVSLLYPW